MRYLYSATNRKGQTKKGYIDSPKKSQAREDLQKQGLDVKSLQVDLKFVFYELMAKVSYVPHLDKVLFTKHLSVMIKAGLPIDESLRILREQAASPAFKRILRVLINTVETGVPLSEGLARFPRVFSELYINVIKAGEKSGNLERNLNDLAVQMTKSHELKSKIRGAMAYPILVLAASFIVGLSIGTFVLPRIIKLFKGFKIELPWTTRALIFVAETFDKYGILIFFGSLAGLALLVWFLRTKFAKPFVHRLILDAPLIKRISRDSNLALFCRTLGTSLRSGLPIVQSIDVASKTFANVIYRNSLKGVIGDLQEGRSLSAALAPIELFPPVVYRMIAVGERTGKLDEVLIFLAEFYENEVDITTKNLSTIVEPLLLIFIGVVVAVLALAIISPIYQITGSIGGRVR